MAENTEFPSSGVADTGDADGQEQPAPLRGLDKRTRRILEERAELLARPEEDQAEAGSGKTVLEFGLAGQRYGMPVDEVDETLAAEDLLPLPCAPAFVLGVTQLRGRVLPALDLGVVLEKTPLPQEEGAPNPGKLLVLSAGGRIAGLAVDEIFGVDFYEDAAITAGVDTLRGREAAYGLGLCQSRAGVPLVLLSGRAIMDDTSLIVRENPEQPPRSES